MNLRNTVLTAALLSTLVSPLTHAGTGFSGLSPSETVALSVVLSPVLIVGGGVMASQAVVDASGRGIKASTGASGRFSENLSTHTEWTVIGMRNAQENTQMDLESADGTMQMTIGVPTSEVNARDVRLQDRITMKKLGTDSFTAEHQGRALGVISDPAAKLAHFFSDSPFRYQAGIWRLEPAVQVRLKRALLGKKANDYHEQAYNMLAYPFSTRYQNSNGWVLELLAWALAPEDEANTRVSAQAWLKKSGYVPTTLELGTMTRLGARVTKANVAFDDHPGDQRWGGHIQTVTVDSMVTWLRTRPDACLDKGCPEIRVKLAEEDAL